MSEIHHADGREACLPASGRYHHRSPYAGPVMITMTSMRMPTTRWIFPICHVREIGVASDGASERAKAHYMADMCGAVVFRRALEVMPSNAPIIVVVLTISTTFIQRLPAAKTDVVEEGVLHPRHMLIGVQGDTLNGKPRVGFHLEETLMARWRPLSTTRSTEQIKKLFCKFIEKLLSETKEMTKGLIDHCE